MAAGPLPARARVFPGLERFAVETLQVNLGRLCNQSCRHCHVDAGPAHGGPEVNAGSLLAEGVLELLRRQPGVATLDLTGGAPELNPCFRRLARGARSLGRRVLVRHNLTVQEVPGQEDLPEFFARHGLVLFCSLPCYLEENVDRQRGGGVFQASLAALRRLNGAGYGLPGGELELYLVYNPVGPSLPPAQERLEADYRAHLWEDYGIRFTGLVTITNQPIHRFREALVRSGALESYEDLLEASFNPDTLPRLMCRTAVSVRWDGRLYDCDFNLVQDLPLRDRSGRALRVQDLLAEGDLARWRGLPIAVDRHCFACTAGCGSSCGGALVE